MSGCGFRDCGHVAVTGEYCAKHAEMFRLLVELQDAADARKKQCAKTLAHQRGGSCLICGYDILPVGWQALGIA